jgi:uncharacterized protein with HEPN domain
MLNNYDLIEIIREECQKITEYVKNIAFEEFMNDKKLNNTCVFKLEQIGETAKDLSPDFRSTYKEIPWRKICGIRDIIAHNYRGLDWKTIWQIITVSVPILLQFCEKTLNER